MSGLSVFGWGSARRVALWPLLLVAALLASMLSLPATAAAETYALLVSASSDRSAPVPLDGTTQTGSIYVFTSPATGVAKVRFYLDDPTMSGTPRQVEKTAPHDFAGTSTDGSALPFKTGGVTAGTHQITAAIDLSAGGTVVLSAVFTVVGSPTTASLTVSASAVQMSALAGGQPVRRAVSLGTSTGEAAAYSSSSSAGWLRAEPATGTAPRSVELVADPGALAAGTYSATMTFTASGFDPATVEVTFTVSPSAGYRVVWSTSSKRTPSQALDGATLTGAVYAFLEPSTNVASTTWWLDDPLGSGTPWQVDTKSPFDFMPNSTATSPRAFNTATVPDGAHTITVLVKLTDGTSTTTTASFVTDNDTRSFTWTPGAQSLAIDPATSTSASFTARLSATDPGIVAELAGSEPFLTTDQGPSVATPVDVVVTVDAQGLSPGRYEFALTAQAPGVFGDTLVVTVEVGDSQGCAPIACELIRVEAPYVLPFDGNQGMIPDRNGIGTGFTTVLTSASAGYNRKALELDSASSAFEITPGAGSFKTTENSQENALGVGLNGGAFNVVTTTLTSLPPLSGSYEQAGLWFGYDQDNVMKLNLLSTPKGLRVEQVLEVGGSVKASKQGALLSLIGTDEVTLAVRADPVTRKLTGRYRVNAGAWLTVASFDAPGEFFSADAAGIDPLVGTRTFAGVFASKRKATTIPIFSFGDFWVTSEDVTAPGAMEFNRTSYAVPPPTSMVFGPDGRLYVLTLMGEIHALTYNDADQVIGDQLITTLGQRLALGITVDPASTAEDVRLWVAHSSPSLFDGEADSGMVTRLSGPGFATRADVITGLPRAIANHGPNSLHFGPDGRLFMAIGGNTGGGAANTAGTEFGDRAEQPLSAALLVADVKAAGFDGSCADPLDIYSSDDCDVQVYSSGLRNTYDFVFHSNGNIYGPDNGLGVVGSYPPSPTPPCRGFGSTVSYKDGGNNPGEQPDELNLLVQGGYYGHPNPTREECVFGDGSYQNVSPPPNYRGPAHDLGRSRSANGIIEYTGDAFCGTLRRQLLVTNYSVGDDMVALRLSVDGTSVLQSMSVAAGFSDPLPLVQAPDGDLVVGEFGSSKVTRLSPIDSGCWTESVPMPIALLDAGGAAIGDDIYVVGGKTPSGPQSDVYVYDVPTGTWSSVAPLPGPAVENPATVAVNGKLYVFAGSTGPFSGAVANAAMYDPGTGAWTVLPNVPTARGGAAAVHLDGSIYLVGGMTGDGASSTVVEVFDLASGTWSSRAPLSEPRDNPGIAALGGRIYVFGGRTRTASGTTVNGALASVEAFDPATGSWSPRAQMPTGRRTMVSVVVGGRAILIGGEGGTDGNAFNATEQYDPVTDTWRQLMPMPTPRHGAAGGVVDGQVHVFGGGPKTGSDWTTKHEVLRPPT